MLSSTFVGPSHEKELAQLMANHRTIEKQTKKNAEKGSEKTKKSFNELSVFVRKDKNKLLIAR